MSEKSFTRITCIALALAVCVSCAMMFSQGSASGVAFEYEDALFDRDSLMTVEIELPQEDWDGLIENARAEEYVSADITINGQKLQSVGIRCKGNSSLTRVGDTDRYSFKVKFDKYISGQTMLGLDKIAFNNTQSDATWMKEYLAYYTMQLVGVDVPLYAFAKIYVNGEFWGLYLAVEVLEQSYTERNFGRNYGNLYKVESMDMGGGKGGGKEMPQAPQGGFEQPDFPAEFSSGEAPEAPFDMPQMPELSEKIEQIKNAMGDEFDELFSGGDEMSDISETIEKVKEKMGGDFGDAFGGRFGGGDGSDLVYTDDSTESYSAIFDKTIFKTTKEADKKRVIAALRGISSEEENDISEYVMVDEMLRYIAGNAAVGNGDGYFGSMMHNYYLYEKDGKITMLPWDYNLAFGGFGESASKLINLDIDAPYTSGSGESRPIIARLLENETYLETYHAYIRQIGEFYVNDAAALIDRLDARIGEWVEIDPTKEYTYEEYTAALPHLKEYLRLRGQSMLNQLEGNDEPIDTGSLSLSAMGSNNGGGHGGDDERRSERKGAGHEMSDVGQNAPQSMEACNGAPDKAPAMPQGMSIPTGKTAQKPDAENPMPLAATAEQPAGDKPQPPEGTAQGGNASENAPKESADVPAMPQGMSIPTGEAVQKPDAEKPMQLAEIAERPDGDKQPPEGTAQRENANENDLKDSADAHAMPQGMSIPNGEAVQKPDAEKPLAEIAERPAGDEPRPPEGTAQGGTANENVPKENMGAPAMPQGMGIPTGKTAQKPDAENPMPLAATAEQPAGDKPQPPEGTAQGGNASENAPKESADVPAMPQGMSIPTGEAVQKPDAENPMQLAEIAERPAGDKPRPPEGTAQGETANENAPRDSADAPAMPQGMSIPTGEAAQKPDAETPMQLAENAERPDGDKLRPPEGTAQGGNASENALKESEDAAAVSAQGADENSGRRDWQRGGMQEFGGFPQGEQKAKSSPAMWWVIGLAALLLAALIFAKFYPFRKRM